VKYRAGVDVFVLNGVILNSVWSSHAQGSERWAFNTSNGESGGYCVELRGAASMTSIVPYDGPKQFPVPKATIETLTMIAQSRIAMLQAALQHQHSRIITPVN
jgi:hypothetical protein